MGSLLPNLRLGTSLNIITQEFPKQQWVWELIQNWNISFVYMHADVTINNIRELMKNSNASHFG